MAMDWKKLRGQQLLDAVDAIAISKFGQSIKPNPEIAKIAGELLVDTMSKNVPGELDPADVAAHAAEIILELRRELANLKP